MSTKYFLKDKHGIFTIDLDQVKASLAKKPGWSRYMVEESIMDYRRFLLLIKKHGGRYELAPTKLIDEAWHQHILFTRKYHHDCAVIFGRYLHHFPVLDNENKRFDFQALDMTRKLYFDEFGEHLFEYRQWVFVYNVIFNNIKRGFYKVKQPFYGLFKVLT